MLSQFMLPGISLLGHLSGILVGVLAVYGVMELLFMPSPGRHACMHRLHICI
jgi:hypothetical protein